MIALKSEVGYMDNSVSYLAFESTSARLERINKRLWIALLVLIVALIGTNAGWIYYENQFEDTVITQEVEAQSDGDSDLNIRTVGGDFYGGESEGNTNN